MYHSPSAHIMAHRRAARMDMGSRAFAARLLVALRNEVWIMISSPSAARKKIHFPAFPDDLCGDCGRGARQAVDGLSAGQAAQFTDLCHRPPATEE